MQPRALAPTPQPSLVSPPVSPRLVARLPCGPPARQHNARRLHPPDRPRRPRQPRRQAGEGRLRGSPTRLPACRTAAGLPTGPALLPRRLTIQFRVAPCPRSPSQAFGGHDPERMGRIWHEHCLEGERAAAAAAGAAPQTTSACRPSLPAGPRRRLTGLPDSLPARSAASPEMSNLQYFLPQLYAQHNPPAARAAAPRGVALPGAPPVAVY
jgi:hypothetical protein